MPRNIEKEKAEGEPTPPPKVEAPSYHPEGQKKKRKKK